MKFADSRCLAVIALSLPLAVMAQAAPTTVRIDLLTDMSGVYADITGKATETAVRLAIDDFLKDSPDRKVELSAADRLNKADPASVRAREWVDTMQVNMVLNGANSAADLAIAKLAQNKKFVHFDVGAATTRLTNEDARAIRRNTFTTPTYWPAKARLAWSPSRPPIESVEVRVRQEAVTQAAPTPRQGRASRTTA